MSHEIHVVKTSDGYELIGKIVKMRNDEVIRVMEPLEIRYRASTTSGPTAVLVPYNPFGKEKFVDIFRSCIVCIYKTTDEYAKTYDDSLKSIEEQLKSRDVDASASETLEKLKEALNVLSSNNTFH